ncbi:MAG: ABC transporter ATP-binding protein [Spirochaeta sp.]|nr:ABC transporter ATP-binding protein [Spirochaeta sp.]
MILEVQDLKINFTTAGGLLQAVRGVSFSVAAGEVLGIVGESGSGKSVTAHSILRLLPGNGEVAGGDIRYNSSSVLSLNPEQLRRFRGQEVGIIFQEPGRSFDPIYSIGKAMSETLRAHNPDMNDEEARRRSIQLLEEAKVPQAAERLGNFPHQFSGGLLQRVMIALALASDPKILIADEPTTALDVTIQAQIIELLLELKERRGLSILFITHNLALISGIADRVVVMYSGLILEQGPAHQVLHAPRHPYTRALLSSILSMGDHHSSRRVAIIRGGVPDPTRPEPGCPFAPRCPLAGPECRAAVPALSSEAGVDHRCIYPGVKGEDLYARS